MQPSSRRRSRASKTWITSFKSVLNFSSFFLFGAAAFTQTLPPEQDRLLAVAKLWVTVEYFHPALAHPNGFDWDESLVKALPAIRSAQNADQYRKAIGALLSRLPEPVTSGVQRTWIHYDFEHSAFATGGPVPQPVEVDLGSGVTVRVSRSEPATSSIEPSSGPDRDYAAEPYPSTELRILAAYKLWGAMHYFFAYRDLMDTDWDDEFAKFLPRFIQAKDAREYHLAVAEAVTKLCDSRTAASSRVLDDYFGPASVGLGLRLVEKKPLVTELLDDAARNSGIQVGDIVLRVDNEDIVKRIDREAAYLPASTHQALSDLVMHRILNGPPDSEASLTVRHHDGGESEVKLKRDYHPTADSAESTKKLSAKLGYIDLTHLRSDQVDAALDEMANKEGLILDARGDLMAEPRAIAAKFNSKPGIAGAIVTGPVLLYPDLPTRNAITRSNSYFEVEEAPVSPNPFKGKIAMLIDERTTGEAEHLGLLLEAANKVPLIGSQTAGACSHLSTMKLPGGITVAFSATDVRHGNTGKLQREGLVPTVEANTELSDVRTGRDVPLEKAVEYLSQQNQ